MWKFKFENANTHDPNVSDHSDIAKQNIFVIPICRGIIIDCQEFKIQEVIPVIP